MIGRIMDSAMNIYMRGYTNIYSAALKTTHTAVSFVYTRVLARISFEFKPEQRADASCYTFLSLYRAHRWGYIGSNKPQSLSIIFDHNYCGK